MCGIVGYVGPDQALPIVMEGLRRLEYRGYDSAGIAVVDGGLSVRKRAGKLAELEALLVADPSSASAIENSRRRLDNEVDQSNTKVRRVQEIDGSDHLIDYLLIAYF